MRCIVAFGLLLAVAMGAPNYELMFEEFKREFGRVYEGEREESMRFAAFVSNMRVAEEMSLRNPLATFGVNRFSDMTKEELAPYHSGLKYDENVRAKQRQSTVQVHEAGGDLKIDWREKGAVTNVKNQAYCEGCWAFSTTGGIEGQWFLAGNHLTSLSEQELLSCDTNDYGCNGGLMGNAISWLATARSGQIVTEKSYPFVSYKGKVPDCSEHLDSMTVGAIVSGYHFIEKSESAMASFVYNHGPLSIGVSAQTWSPYKGGIMTNCPAQSMDHGVLIVGLDETYITPYWIVKNSWGADWGEKGYIRLEMWTDQCSLTGYPISSVAKKREASSVVQKTCSDRYCSDCHEEILLENKCVARGDTWVRAELMSNAVVVTEYREANCGGEGQALMVPTDQCLAEYGDVDKTKSTMYTWGVA